MPWQPIETAPKGEVIILLLQYGQLVAAGFYARGEPGSGYDDEWVALLPVLGGRMAIPIAEPVGWMPLPSPKVLQSITEDKPWIESWLSDK
jgi:hypothetical protein